LDLARLKPAASLERLPRRQFIGACLPCRSPLFRDPE